MKKSVNLWPDEWPGASVDAGELEDTIYSVTDFYVS